MGRSKDRRRRNREKAKKEDMPTTPHSSFTEDGRYIVLQARDEEEYKQRLEQEYNTTPDTKITPVI